MLKNILSYSLIVFIFAAVPSVYAGKVELTTYYPAPYGEYKEIKTTEKAEFAQTSGTVKVGSATNHTVLAVDNVLTLDPVAVNPGDANLTAGSLCYSTNAGGAGIGGMLYSNGTVWKNLGGGTGTITSVSRNSAVQTNNSLWEDVPDMAVTKSFSGGVVLVNFLISQVQAVSQPSGHEDVIFRILCDADVIAEYMEYSGYVHTVTMVGATNLSSGSHTIKVQWHTGSEAGATLKSSVLRVLKVIEIS
jgi:hypothetical protein